MPEDIGDKFTISTWVKMGLSKGRQTIVANTDKERLDRVHFSLSVSGCRLYMNEGVNTVFFCVGGGYRDLVSSIPS